MILMWYYLQDKRENDDQGWKNLIEMGLSIKLLVLLSSKYFKQKPSDITVI